MAQEAAGKCGELKAWHNRQPPGPAILHVIGKCMFPTSGYSVELRPHKPPGINPSIYLLDKIVHAPTGPVKEVITEAPVHYAEITDAPYKEVEIFPDGARVPVEESS